MMLSTENERLQADRKDLTNKIMMLTSEIERLQIELKRLGDVSAYKQEIE